MKPMIMKNAVDHGAAPKEPKNGFHGWMDENYPETCKDAQAIFNELGFETAYDDVGNLHLVAYDTKMGQEDLFLKSIATNAIGKIDWIGEDGETWSTIFMGDTVIDSEPTMKLLS